MLDKLKENAFLGFTLSLIASYFGVSGYYAYYSFDISSFLTIEDLILIFARHVWLVAIGMFVLWSFWARLDEQLKNRKKPFTIQQKRLISAIVIAMMILLNYLLSKHLNLESFLWVSIGGALTVLIMYGVVTFAFLFLKDTTSIAQISMRGWFYLIAALYFFIVAIPVGGGMAMAHYSNHDTLNMELDDSTVINTTQ